MNKKLKLSLALSALFVLGAVTSLAGGIKPVNADNEMCYVDFFNNYKREDFTLSNGVTGKGNNLLYKSVQVAKDSLVSKPDDPQRTNYAFKGWFIEEACEVEWNFAQDKVEDNMRLFAKWEISGGAEIVEPAYVPPSTVLEESASTNYVLNSVMYFKINDSNQVKLSTAAIKKLEAQKDNVLPLMEYKVKASKSITATYDNNVITVTCGDETKNIQVIDDSINLIINNSTYESKAVAYEKNYLTEDIHHVMLAGSSSIEFWTSSSEDLDPIVSYNHGIGGTTIEQWDEQLNKRLVFPYKPKMVVYYVGINNVINSKETKEVIWNRLEKFMNNTHEALPDTKVQYIMMNLLPGYPTYKETINYVNSKIAEYQTNNAGWLTLINPGLALLKENGEPNAAYFRTDGLHLSYYGYEVWGEIIKQSILDGLKN